MATLRWECYWGWPEVLSLNTGPVGSVSWHNGHLICHCMGGIMNVTEHSHMVTIASSHVKQTKQWSISIKIIWILV